MNNVAIIGTGYGERVLKKCIEYSQNYHLRYILSRKKKGTIFISNIKEIIKDKTLKLICIETPPFTHLQLLKKFKNHKIKILCEKPIVHNLKELELLKKLIENYKYNLFINHQLRYHPSLIIFKKELKKIGKIRHIKITYNSNNISEKKRNSWWLDNKKGGGHLLAIGPHLLDLLNFFYGNLKTLDKKLKFIKKFNKKIDIAFNLNGFLYNGIKYQISSTCFSKRNNTYFNLKASGSQGIVKFENFKRIKIIRKKNIKLIKLTDLFTDDSFFMNPWRVAQFYYVKNIFQSYKKKLNYKKNILQSIKNLDLILEKN